MMYLVLSDGPVVRLMGTFERDVLGSLLRDTPGDNACFPCVADWDWPIIHASSYSPT